MQPQTEIGNGPFHFLSAHPPRIGVLSISPIQKIKVLTLLPRKEDQSADTLPPSEFIKRSNPTTEIFVFSGI